MFIVYIIKSISKNRFYTGHTQNLEIRLKRHNAGQVKSTEFGIPWKVVYTERYLSRRHAYQREMEIKSYKGGIKFKKLVGLFK